jgi:ABC-type Fe3+-siderophore transport system permease subunit
MDLAKTVIAAVLGLIAGILVFPWANAYVIALLAFVFAIAVGALVYFVVRSLLSSVPTRRY